VFQTYRNIGGDMMKTRFLVIVLVLAAFSVPCFASAVHVTGDVSADFLGGATTQQIVNTFAVGDQPLFWGFGWEVILGNVGFGGDYTVSFFRDAGAQWWVDWYAPALFLSYHPIGANHLIDPFVQLGVGSTGQVLLDIMSYNTTSGLSLSVFPFVAAGVNLNLGGFLLGLKAAYTPYSTEIPVTNIPGHPVGTFQVTATAGFAITWGRK
jgi:hypothetical protein